MFLLRRAFRFPASSVLPCLAVSTRATPEGAWASSFSRYSTDAQPAKSSFPVGWTAIGGVGAAALAYYAFGWKNELAPVAPATASSQATEPAKCVLDPKNFAPYPLKSTRDVTHNTKIFTFALPDPADKLGLPVASCILTRFKKPDGEGFVVRPYTPISTDEEKGVFDLLVKVYNGGPMSEHIFALKTGDTLEVKGPLLKFEYEPNKWSKIGMIAGGTGLTPMLQVLRKILDNPEDNTKVSLLFANQEERDIILKSELDALANKHPDRFQVHYTVDRPSSSWTGDVGFVSKSMVQKYMHGKDENATVLVCGPQGMMAHVSGSKTPDFQQGELGGILAELGYTKDRVFKF